VQANERQCRTRIYKRRHELKARASERALPSSAQNGLADFSTSTTTITVNGELVYVATQRGTQSLAQAKVGNYVVYQGIDAEGTVRYVGITSRDPNIRFTEHRNSGTERSFLDYKEVNGLTNLTRIEARIWEQKLINKYGLSNLYNKINSIAPQKQAMYGINP
jgi:hypothetical protein